MRRVPYGPGRLRLGCQPRRHEGICKGNCNRRWSEDFQKVSKVKSICCPSLSYVWRRVSSIPNPAQAILPNNSHTQVPLSPVSFLSLAHYPSAELLYLSCNYCTIPAPLPMYVFDSCDYATAGLSMMEFCKYPSVSLLGNTLDLSV